MLPLRQHYLQHFSVSLKKYTIFVAKVFNNKYLVTY